MTDADEIKRANLEEVLPGPSNDYIVHPSFQKCHSKSVLKWKISQPKSTQRLPSINERDKVIVEQRAQETYESYWNTHD